MRVWVPQPIRLLTPVVRATENLSVSPVSVWSVMPVHEIDPSATSPEVVVPTKGAVVPVLLGGRYMGWSRRVEFGACAPLYRAPVPITFPDNTSGFNGIEVYDLKY